MKRTTKELFFRTTENNLVAIKKSGYVVQGGFFIHKEENGWRVSDVGTGCAVADRFRLYRNALKWVEDNAARIDIVERKTGAYHALKTCFDVVRKGGYN